MKAPSVVGELHTAEVDSLPPLGDIEHGQLFALRLSNDTSELTHGMHRFPAKFIPQIPRWALRQFAGDGACVVDPFMGSGTTLVEGLVHGGTVLGVDIDPLARLIAGAKTSVPSPARIEQLGEMILRRFRVPATELVPPMPGIADFEHWFSRDAWAKLQSLHRIILEMECDNSERRFLMAVFSSILRWVSNADDQSHKTYVSGTHHKEPPEVMGTFWRRFDRAVQSAKELEAAKMPGSCALISDTGDACAIGLPPESVDLIVTSPPYLDSVDYMYNFMLEYFWLGPILGIPDRESFNRLRRTYIGAKMPERSSGTLPKILSGLVDESAIAPNRMRAASTYFCRMSEHFAEAARCMRTGARYILVIGNSQTKSSIIPVHDCLIRLASLSGLELEKAFGYRIRRHYMKFPRNGRGGIILIDWIACLRKTASPIAVPERLPLPWVTLEGDAVAN